MEAQKITPLHAVRDRQKVTALVASMMEHGWIGRPIVCVNLGDTTQALTGSHRIAAAAEAGVDVPVKIIDGTIHILGMDGACEICGEECVIEQLLAASDDDERAAIPTEKVGVEIAELLQAEIQ